jgi:hypothetical protein
MNKKNFFFTEEVTLEALDPKSKIEVIFGNITPNYYVNSLPPGLTAPILSQHNPSKNNVNSINLNQVRANTNISLEDLD